MKSQSRTAVPHCCMWLTLSLSIFAASASAEKTDVVILENGDHVTGEVKSFELGKLRYSTDAMGTVEIEWDDIATIQSDRVLQIELARGQRYLGRLDTPPESGVMVVTYGESTQELDMSDVVRITAIDVEEGFWKRLDGSLNFGFSFTKASDVSQTSFGAGAAYRTEQRQFRVDVSSITTTQKEAETTERQNFSFDYRRFRRNRWFVSGVFGAERNEELGIDLRLLSGGGVGRYLRQTPTSLFSLGGGLVVTRESFSGPEPSATNLEGNLRLDWNLIRFKMPETNLFLSLNVFPSLSEFGRVRSSFDARLRRELVEDVFFDLTFYNTFDSEPPPQAARSDYGIITSLGWSF